MARYIDADKAKDEMKFGDGDFILWEGKTYVDISIIEKAIVNAPTADVVPKNEYEIAIREVGRLSQEVLLNCEITEFEVKEAKAKLSRKIFEEIERLLDNHHSACLPVGEIVAYTYYEGGLGEAIAELKKKYME